MDGNPMDRRSHAQELALLSIVQGHLLATCTYTATHLRIMRPPHRLASVSLVFTSRLKSQFIPRHPVFRYRMASTTTVRTPYSLSNELPY